MAITRTYESLCDDARARTDREADPACSNDVLQPWINQMAREARVIAARMRPDEYTKESATFQVVTGNTFVVAQAGGVDATSADFLAPRLVMLTMDSVHWLPLRPFRFYRRGAVGELSYRFRGLTLELLPVELAKQWPLRMLYITRPPEMPGEATTIDLAVGEDDYICEGVAAKIRAKFEEDPLLHLSAKKAAEGTMQRWFGVIGQGPPEPVLEASPWEDPGGW